MKVQLNDGTWLVHMGMGIIAPADTIEDAEKLELDAVRCVFIALGLFVVMVVCVFGFVWWMGKL